MKIQIIGLGERDFLRYCPNSDIMILTKFDSDPISVKLSQLEESSKISLILDHYGY